jgi:hypothetical protein
MSALRPPLWLASTPEVIDPSEGWHYAAWVAVDLRLLFFLMFISLLSSFGVCLILVRKRDLVRVLATFIVAYTISLSALLIVFNTIAHYPVFQLQSFFPFP